MKIAIQGHPTRGNEVIQILESLGGKNNANLKGVFKKYYYFIDLNDTIDYTEYASKNIHTYTLEKFKKEFPFKIGDRVITITTNLRGIITNLKENGWYYVKCDNGHFVCIFGQHLKLYKEMKEERNITLTLDKAKEWYKKGGELKEIALQAFTKAELNPLPRNWDDYCKYASTLTTSFSSCAKYDAFVKLEHLRDCWLDGWKPKWDASQKWCIRLYKNQLHVGLCTDISRFLTFPTREMAEEFLKCFRDLIELAKDLI